MDILVPAKTKMAVLQPAVIVWCNEHVFIIL